MNSFSSIFSILLESGVIVTGAESDSVMAFKDRRMVRRGGEGRGEEKKEKKKRRRRKEGGGGGGGGEGEEGDGGGEEGDGGDGVVDVIGLLKF